MNLKTQKFIVDDKGNKTAVIIAYKDYLHIIKKLEDIEDSKLIQDTKEEPTITLSEYKKKRSIV